MAINDSATHEIDIIRYLLNENIVSVRVDKPQKKTRRACAHLQDPLIVILKPNPAYVLMMSCLLTAIMVTTFAVK